jgi:hypothetical protein
VNLWLKDFFWIKEKQDKSAIMLTYPALKKTALSGFTENKFQKTKKTVLYNCPAKDF